MKQLGRVLTIVPAKGASTRLPRKNLLPLGGRPLIDHTLAAAWGSEVGGVVMVDTEDEEIAAHARRLGAEVPFLRPDHLSHDPYEVPDVALHVLDQYEAMGQHFDTLIILLVTAPLRTAEDIRAAVGVFREKDARFLMTVTRVDPHYYHALHVDEEGRLSPVFGRDGLANIGLPPIPVRCNGAVHVLDVPAFREARTYYGEPLYAVEMPVARSVDIDTADDLAYAEFLLSRQPPQP